jgi:hypothetical protein
MYSYSVYDIHDVIEQQHWMIYYSTQSSPVGQDFSAPVEAYHPDLFLFFGVAASFYYFSFSLFVPYTYS